MNITNLFTIFGTAPDDLIEKRRKICFECPSLMNNVEYLEQCSICFCFVRAKTKILSEKCPSYKW